MVLPCFGADAICGQTVSGFPAVAASGLGHFARIWSILIGRSGGYNCSRGSGSRSICTWGSGSGKWPSHRLCISVLSCRRRFSSGTLLLMYNRDICVQQVMVGQLVGLLGGVVSLQSNFIA